MMPMLLLFPHHTDNRNSVAIVCIGEVAATLCGRKRKRVGRKVRWDLEVVQMLLAVGETRGNDVPW